jgi:hypothetical protein
MAGTRRKAKKRGKTSNNLTDDDTETSQPGALDKHQKLKKATNIPTSKATAKKDNKTIDLNSNMDGALSALTEKDLKKLLASKKKKDENLKRKAGMCHF